MRFAAIDVGTNTTRLLVAEAEGRSYRDLDRRLLFTRLGEGVDAGARIKPEAMKRTLEAIAEYCSVCGEFGVQQISIAGTSALRDAANREAFLKAAEKLVGVPARALSGDEEAWLSFWGATADLIDGPCLVCDIGGGSTEFILGVPRSDTLLRTSLDLGSVRLTERFLHSDPPATEEMLLMESAIDEALEVVDHVIPGSSGARLVGLGGTVTTVAAIHLGIEHYRPEIIHLAELSSGEVNEIYHSLAGMTVEQRMSLPNLPQGRADVIVAGASILSRTMARWSLDGVLVSEKDILDGLVLQMIQAQGPGPMPGPDDERSIG
jgi:exopolyphosphatase / guanosine-5'-triphosphate,3'-diphosphate pyrophosphatase